MQNIATNLIPSAQLTIAAVTANLNAQLKSYAAHEVTVTNNLQQQLYAPLGDAHSLCVYLQNSANSAYAEQFKKHIKEVTGKNCPDDKVVTNVLKLVFEGIDSKKAYTYRTVINYAIEKDVPAGLFVSFVNELKGLENARKAKYADDRAKQGITQVQTRRIQTQTYVAQQPLSVVPESVLQATLPSTAVGQQFVLVVSRLDNGLIAFNAVSVEDEALAAAYRCVYKNAKEAIKSVVVPSAPTTTQQATAQQTPVSVPPQAYTAVSGNAYEQNSNPVDDALDTVKEEAAA